MILNYIWIAFLLIAFIVACVQTIFFGNSQIFSEIMTAAFGSAKSGFEISLGLTGALSLWLGVMKIGEKGGVLERLSRIVAPFFCQDISRNTERSSCNYKYIHEFIGHHAGTRQCCHSHGFESNERIAGIEY